MYNTTNYNVTRYVTQYPQCHLPQKLFHISSYYFRPDVILFPEFYFAQPCSTHFVLHPCQEVCFSVYVTCCHVFSAHRQQWPAYYVYFLCPMFIICLCRTLRQTLHNLLHHLHHLHRLLATHIRTSPQLLYTKHNADNQDTSFTSFISFI